MAVEPSEKMRKIAEATRERNKLVSPDLQYSKLPGTKPDTMTDKQWELIQEARQDLGRRQGRPTFPNTTEENDQ